MQVCGIGVGLNSGTYAPSVRVSEGASGAARTRWRAMWRVVGQAVWGEGVTAGRGLCGCVRQLSGVGRAVDEC